MMDNTARWRRRTFLGAAAVAGAGATTMLGTDAAAVATGPTTLGNGVLIESFRQAGYTDDQTFAAALSYAAAQTYKPTLILGAQEYELFNTYTAYKGMSLFGFGVEREFETASSWDSVYCRVYKHGNGPLFTRPTTGNFTSMRISGIQFEGNQNGGSDFIAPTPRRPGLPRTGHVHLREMRLEELRIRHARRQRGRRDPQEIPRPELQDHRLQGRRLGLVHPRPDTPPSTRSPSTACRCCG
jgi:hypothetical protein